VILEDLYGEYVYPCCDPNTSEVLAVIGFESRSVLTQLETQVGFL